MGGCKDVRLGGGEAGIANWNKRKHNSKLKQEKSTAANRHKRNHHRRGEGDGRPSCCDGTNLYHTPVYTDMRLEV